ncbi:uncharacterized protein [Nicotiana tomentosiformis]|uniref:uncharacterized protein n=1 Tax=Nicotiana tomentosiformis TaxID=4098 RepID=UPI00388C8D3B
MGVTEMSRFAVNPFSNVKSYYLPLLHTYTKMAKTSKTVPKKKAASSSQSVGGKMPVEPRLEECIPGGLGKDAVMRPPYSEEETSTPVQKPTKDKKRKRTSTSEDPKPKKKSARMPKKDVVALPADVIQRLREEKEEDEDDGSELVARVKKTIESPKAAELVVVEEIPPRAERVLEKDSGKVPELSKIEDASRRDWQKAGMFEGASSEAFHSEENSPSGSLGEIDIGDSPILPAFSEEAIREAQAMRTPEVDRGHGGEDPFRGYFIGVEDATDLNEASSLFDEAQQALNRALALRQEAFSKSRAELSRCEADLQGLTEERNALKLLSGKKEEEIKDLRAELAKAHQDQTDLIEQVMKILKAHRLNLGMVANISISQLQQKVERIEQFREEFDTMKAETLGWKESMDRFAAEKEAARAQLSSVETEKAKAEAEAIVAVYRADAEAAQVQAREAAEIAQTRVHWIAELTKCQSHRETLEEIYARGFDLTDEIIKAREHEADDRALASSDDDDDGSKSESENREDLDGEEAAPEEN